MACIGSLLSNRLGVTPSMLNPSSPHHSQSCWIRLAHVVPSSFEKAMIGRQEIRTSSLLWQCWMAAWLSRNIHEHKIRYIQQACSCMQQQYFLASPSYHLTPALHVRQKEHLYMTWQPARSEVQRCGIARMLLCSVYAFVRYFDRLNGCWVVSALGCVLRFEVRL